VRTAALRANPTPSNAISFRRTKKPFKLDDGPRTVAFVQQKIFDSGWSYVRIADNAGVCNSTVNKIATGETKRPAWPTIARILIALGVSIYAAENSDEARALAEAVAEAG
jgi:transcriptional regulator with XRE-family HTH domain